ncbi:MAG: hypothetical protein ACOC5R_00060 [Elusimicrobiota bacterium]
MQYKILPGVITFTHKRKLKISTLKTKNSNLLKIILIPVLIIIGAGIVKGKDIQLFDEKELECFEIEKSSCNTILEEFEDFLLEKHWLEYDKSLWNNIKQRKEKGTYQEPEELEEFETKQTTGTLEGIEEMPQAEVELPYQTRLSITGRKSISIKYGNVFYRGDEDERTVTGTPSGATSGFEMDQELKVRIKGKVGEKITVNVNYDDTKPAYDESARKISVLYKGDPDEVIQEAAFGDVTLRIPSTHFVGYSKNVFGISVKGQYDKLKFMAIGSQTKGKTDVKEFTGQTTFTKKDIKDISYIRRKYYDIDLDTTTSHFPLVKGSVNIYVDDKDSSNILENNESTMTVKYFNSTDTYTGYFYNLVAGRDYVVDYNEGVLTFNHSIRSNYVIAIEYEYDGGNKEVGYSTYPVILKDEKETLDYELKNRYSLGAKRILRDDFVLDIMDLNRNIVSIPTGTYNVDYDLGIIEFTKETPFYDPTQPEEGYNKGGFEDIYDKTDPQQHYIIYVEYEKKIKTYFLRPNIIRGSERVLMDGELLQRDRDYMIDYPSGFLTFLNPQYIDETTKIEVTYEYMPFGGLFKETLVGLRGEYNFSNNFFLGGTLLHNWSSAAYEIPSLHSTPASSVVLDTDFNLKIPKKKYFPIPVTIKGEAATSKYNPNTMGKAMIDNMEGIKQAYSVPMSPDSWQIAATPSGNPGNPDWFTLEDDEIYLSEINEKIDKTDDEKRQIMYINYSFPSGADEERSIVYPVSSMGTDLSNKDSIEIWIKGDGKNEDIQVDFGSISEDADGTGKFKTEDKNKNGTLDLGEDVGWDYIYDGSVYKIGEDNGEIDTNDLDGDGFLDTIQDYRSITKTINWNGWKKVVFDRPGDDSDWSAVKHVRITLKGSNISGKIGIASLEVIGNKWEVVNDTTTLKLKAINNYDHTYYRVPLEEEIYTNIYDDVGGSDLEKEQALELEYVNLTKGATVYAYTKYSQAVDLSLHRKINFLFYNYEGMDADFFISLGAGDNFFIKRVPLKDVGTGEWIKKSFKLPFANNTGDFERIGSPSIANIKEIRIGVINTSDSDSSGKFWINELYLDHPQTRNGLAYRGSLSSSIPGILDFGGTYEKIDKDFQTITTPPKNQDRETYSLNAKLTAVPFLPIKGDYSKSEVETPKDRIKPAQQNEYIRKEDAGLVTKESKGIGADFSVRNLPGISGNYSQSVDDSNVTGKIEKTENFKGNMSYNTPIEFFLIPTRIQSGFRKTDTNISWRESMRPEGGYEDLLEETIDYSGSADFKFFDILTFKPSYSRNEKHKEWDFYTGQYEGEKKRWPWSKTQNAGISANLSLFGWFRPRGSYKVDINQNYNYKDQDGVSLLDGTKNVNRNFNLDGGLSISANKIVSGVKPINTLSVSADFEVEKGEIYKNIEENYSVFEKIDQRYDLFDPYYSQNPSNPSANLETLTGRNAEKYTVTWSPFKFLNIENEILKAIGDVYTRTMFQYINTKKEIKGTVLDTETRIFPEMDLNFGKITKLPFGEKYIKNLDIKAEYRNKSEITFSDAREIEKELSGKYRTNLRFLLLKEYDSFIEYYKNWQEEYDLEVDRLDTSSNKITLTGQVKFKLKKYWNLIVKYSQTSDVKTSYNSSDPLTDKHLYKPGVSFDAIINTPSSFNIPLIGKKIEMVNRLKLNGSFNMDFSRSILNKDKTNTNKYMVDFSAEMDVSSNMRFTFGLGLSHLHNLERYINGYTAFHLQTQMEIRF